MEDLFTAFGRQRAIAAAGVPRSCVRCGADLHTGDPPHLCRDVRGRLNAHRNQRRQHLRAMLRG